MLAIRFQELIEKKKCVKKKLSFVDVEKMFVGNVKILYLVGSYIIQN